jgi:hypothetical protein
VSWVVSTSSRTLLSHFPSFRDASFNLFHLLYDIPPSLLPFLPSSSTSNIRTLTSLGSQIWTIHRFVTPSKKSKSKPKYAIESTPSHADSITTPALAGTTPNVNGLENSGAKMNGYASTHTNDGTATPEAIGRTLLAAAVREEEPEGGVLCSTFFSVLFSGVLSSEILTRVEFSHVQVI